jgi:hypothetical protein
MPTHDPVRLPAWLVGSALSVAAALVWALVVYLGVRMW